MGERTTVLLVRHGQAESAGDGDDRERRLTTEGAAELRACCEGLRVLGVRLDAVLTSPLARAHATAAILVEELGDGTAPEADAALAPGAALAPVLAAMRAQGSWRTIALVGHAPDLTALVAGLVAPGGPRTCVFAPGSVACVEFVGDARAAAGRLLWARSPAALVALASP